MELKNLLNGIDNDFMMYGDKKLYSDVESFIDTGSYTLNALCSGSIYGGIASGKITAIAGESSTGKSFLTLGIVKNFLDSNENAYCIYFESEGALTSQILQERGIDMNKCVIIPVSTVNDFRNTAFKILENYEKDEKRNPLLMVLDSVGMLSTEHEIDVVSSNKTTKDMSRSSDLKGCFRVLSLKLSLLNVSLICTNHVYASMGLFPTMEMSGGSGLKYSANSIIMLSKSKEKTSDGTLIGASIKCKLAKSRICKEELIIKTLINHRFGLDKAYGLLDLAIASGVWKKLSTKIEIDENTKVFASVIQKSPEKYYTQELLDKIDIWCKNNFRYGSNNVINLDNTDDELD